MASTISLSKERVVEVLRHAVAMAIGSTPEGVKLYQSLAYDITRQLQQDGLDKFGPEDLELSPRDLSEYPGVSLAPHGRETLVAMRQGQQEDMNKRRKKGGFLYTPPPRQQPD